MSHSAYRANSNVVGRTAYGYSGLAGSYNGVSRDVLQAVALPDQIKCNRCKKHLKIHNYSNEAKTQLQYSIKMGDTSLSSVKCMTCVGGPRTELMCATCEEVKAHADFSRRQRTFGDAAICNACIAGHQALNTTGMGEAARDVEADYAEEEDFPDDDTKSIVTNENSVTSDANDNEDDILVARNRGANLPAHIRAGRTAATTPSGGATSNRLTSLGQQSVRNVSTTTGSNHDDAVDNLSVRVSLASVSKAPDSDDSGGSDTECIWV